MKQPLSVPITIALLIAIAFGIKLLADAGAFRTIQPHFSGTCRGVGEVQGPEDLEYSAATGVLFISSDSRPAHPGARDPDGAIYTLNTRDTNAKPVRLISGHDLGFEFHPHGLSVLDGPTGPRLWAINHRPEATTIEIFDYLGGQLKHQQTLRDPLLRNANDLVAIDMDRFYVTSDHGHDSSFLNRLEDYSRIGRGYVSYYDGAHFSQKALGIAFANGIIYAESKIWVASMLGREILSFRRNAATGDLTLDSRIPLGSCPDNLTFDKERREIWVGAHPKLFNLKTQSEDRSKHAPAQTLRVKLPPPERAGPPIPVIEEILLDDGNKISASSVALTIGNRLLLGSIYDNQILDCQIQ